MLTREYNTKIVNSFITVSRGLRYTNGKAVAGWWQWTPGGGGKICDFLPLPPDYSPPLPNRVGTNGRNFTWPYLRDEKELEAHLWI